MSWRNFLLGSFSTLLVLLGGGFWYVFVAGTPQLDPPPIEADTGLSFQIESFKSQAMGEVREYGVILPPDYATSPQRRYPVIFLLHGGHGDARAYEDKAAVTSVLHDLYRSKKLPPAIVITPDGNDKRGTSPFWDSNYFDGPNGKVGTLIGEELVAVVKSRYRTLEDPKFWAIGGQSSGGWGALNIGLRHLDNFQVFFSSSGYFTDSSGAENSPNVFIANIPAQQRQNIRIFLDAGEDDKEFRASTLQFHQTLRKLGIGHEYHLYRGGHGIVGPDSGWNYWHKHLYDQLSYVGKQYS
ncbi:alpha/beta hydrolase-fold protein [Oscillatoria sp. FACHB-1406]|uniref:alpha/beta hydrolase n=1 Tax=Oscillatoria sp. FACHB-1406 TaxID=2692846 RepID=UPI001688586A|nr:alpha/beta hydrolase-fold protein [Oscillatoria sp. FACHB-1406]MBD2580393.1 esterase family protein [Oscillatoria sp. FACHB-1406]